MATPPTTASSLDASKFMGLWYVTHSNLDFWSSRGGRFNARIEYKRIDQGDVFKFNDEVMYEVKGGFLSSSSKFKTKSVLGIDTQDPQLNSHFSWVGTGMLRFLSSEWYVVFQEDDWAVTYFSATLFTKEGCDIYCRTPVIPPEKLEIIKARIEADPFMKEKAKGLFETQRVEV
eukprot:Colp12_sorted_trinity150504_noHs@25295